MTVSANTIALTHCSVVECSRRHHARTLCNAHRERARGAGILKLFPTTRDMKAGRAELLVLTEKEFSAHCVAASPNASARRFRSNGPRKPQLVGVTVEEYLSHRAELNPETLCLVWTGATNPHGYPQARIDNRVQLVHRSLFAKTNGLQLPEFIDVDHICSTGKLCVQIHHHQALPKDAHQEVTRLRKRLTPEQLATPGLKVTSGIAKGALLTAPLPPALDVNTHREPLSPEDAALLTATAA